MKNLCWAMFAFTLLQGCGSEPSKRSDSPQQSEVENQCKPTFTWAEDQQQCCREVIAEKNCLMEGDENECLVWDTKKQQECN